MEVGKPGQKERRPAQRQKHRPKSFALSAGAILSVLPVPWNSILSLLRMAGRRHTQRGRLLRTHFVSSSSSVFHKLRYSWLLPCR